MEYLVGINPVREALTGGRPLVEEVWLLRGSDNRRLEEIAELASDLGVLVRHVDRRELDVMARGLDHQGAIGSIGEFEYTDMEDVMVRAADSGADPLIVLLDGVEDPRNLGAVIRSAEALGAHAVVIRSRRSARVTSTVHRTSQGASLRIPIVSVTNLNSTIDRLKEVGLWIAGAHVGVADLLYSADLAGPLALVIGGEDTGLSRLTREKCDLLVAIPMQGTTPSLNTSVAASIFLYEVVRQRATVGEARRSGE